MASYPYELKIPSQGVVQVFQDKSELGLFVENEAKFFREHTALLSGNLVWANTNYGNLNLAEQANRFFDHLMRALEANTLAHFDQYAQSAQDFAILVSQGRIGSRVRDLLKKERQEQAKWVILLTCPQWIGGQQNVVLEPFRAALTANPATFAFGDLLTASEAMERSSTALTSIQRAKDDLTNFIETKTDLFDKLEVLYRQKLTLDEPALTWRNVASRKTSVWATWLMIFAVLVASPIIVAVSNWPTVSEAIIKLTAGANGSFSVAGLAAITIPALFYAWLLKNVSRVFIQNLNLADDAAHRRSLALTYLGLLQDEKHPASDQDRAIILNALFRPIPPQTADEGPPAGLMDLIRNKP